MLDIGGGEGDTQLVSQSPDTEERSPDKYNIIVARDSGGGGKEDVSAGREGGRGQGVEWRGVRRIEGEMLQ